MSFAARQIDAPEVLKAPNFNFISANVEQTSGGNQTESAKPTSTNKVLAVSSFQEMVGILKQVNMVAYHASSIFSSLGKKVQETSRKVRKVSDRIASLEKDVFDMEQQKNSDSSFTRVEDSEFHPRTWRVKAARHYEMKCNLFKTFLPQIRG